MSKTILALLAILLALGAVVAWAAVGTGAQDAVFSVLAWIETFGSLAPVLLALIYVIATLLLVPGAWLTLAAGFLFGIPLGMATISLSGLASAAMAFLLSRTLLRQRILRHFSGRAKFQALDEAVGREGFKMVLLVRLSPLLPFGVLNYTFGATRVRLGDYLLATWLGMLPGTLLYVYLGSTLKSLAEIAAGRSQETVLQDAFLLFGLVMTVVATLYVTQLARRTLRQVVDQPPDAAGLPI